MYGVEQAGIQSCQARQSLSIRAIVFTGVVVDGAQLAGIGDKDLVTEILEQVAYPTGMGADLHGHPGGR